MAAKVTKSGIQIREIGPSNAGQRGHFSQSVVRNILYGDNLPRVKPNGSIRVILDVGKLNIHIHCPHFKMLTLIDVEQLLQ